MASYTGCALELRVYYGKDGGMTKTHKPITYRRMFLKEWRIHRGFQSQAALADHIGSTQETISRLERGKLPYHQPMLETLAEALRCEPADILARDPSKEDALALIWAEIAPKDRPQALKVLQSFRKTGTDS